MTVIAATSCHGEEWQPFICHGVLTGRNFHSLASMTVIAATSCHGEEWQPFICHGVLTGRNFHSLASMTVIAATSCHGEEWQPCICHGVLTGRNFHSLASMTVIAAPVVTVRTLSRFNDSVSDLRPDHKQSLRKCLPKSLLSFIGPATVRRTISTSNSTKRKCFRLETRPQSQYGA